METDITAALYGEGEATPAADAATEAKPAASAADATPDPNAFAEAKPAAEAKPGEKPAGAPETYTDFTLPDGFDMDTALLGEFTPTLKELNLTQEQAQKVIDFAPKLVEAAVKNSAAAFMKANGLEDRTTWQASVREDKELGGEKLAENLAIARRGLEAYASPAFKEFLQKTGLGNHPEMVRAWFKAGKDVAPKETVRGAPPKAAVSFFDKSRMNP